MGSLVNKLKNFFKALAGEPTYGLLIFKVRCSKCGEEITVRARKYSDISRIYEGEGPAGAEYFLRKEILGKKCNNLIYVSIYFGHGFNIISRDISGGEFID
jgi:hypothetical protein